MLLHRYKKLLLVLITVAVLSTIYLSERYLSRRRKLKEEIIKTLNKIDYFEKNVLSNGE